MTANEMKAVWLLKLDSLFEGSAPAYSDKHISFMLSNAQIRVFKKHYNPLGNKYKKGFEFDEQRRRDLEQFIKAASVSGGEITVSSNQTGVHPNGIFYDLPSTFYMNIEESVKLGQTGVEVNVKSVTHNEYNININNIYKKPYSLLVWRMDFSRVGHGEDGGDAKTGQTAKRIELITDGSSITDYRIRYIINPPEIVCDSVTIASQRHCILDDTLHDEIIDEAIKIAKSIIEQEEYQISSIEKESAE